MEYFGRIIDDMAFLRHVRRVSGKYVFCSSKEKLWAMIIVKEERNAFCFAEALIICHPNACTYTPMAGEFVLVRYF